MGANIIIPSEISKEYFKVVDFEDANQRDKPKGRFFRSVRLYLTDIMIDICRKWRIYLAKKNGERGFCIWRHRPNRAYTTYRTPTR